MVRNFYLWLTKSALFYSKKVIIPPITLKVPNTAVNYVTSRVEFDFSLYMIYYCFYALSIQSYADQKKL